METSLVPVSGEQSAQPMTIADRVRTARIAANKTQQQLAGDTYSKSYISAVERGKMTPSVQALGVLAERLGLPISYFLDESEMDLSALVETSASLLSLPEQERLVYEERLALLLSEAEGWIRQRQPELALERLGQQETCEKLHGPQRVYWHLLEGWAWLLKQSYGEARRFLGQGLTLADHLCHQVPLSQQKALEELAELTRCLIGTAYATRPSGACFSTPSPQPCRPR